MNEQRLQGVGGRVDAQTRHRLTITLSPSIFPPLSLNRPCHCPIGRSAESPFRQCKLAKEKSKEKHKEKKCELRVFLVVGYVDR